MAMSLRARIAVASVVFLACWGLTYSLFYPRHFLGDVPLFEGFGGVQLAQMAVAS